MSEQRWWWDLAAGRAVRDDERGPDRDVLGPYPTKAAAEAWRERHDSREDTWEQEDERWDEAEGSEGSEGSEGERGRRAP